MLLIQPLKNRKTICIKGYEDGIGKANTSIESDRIISFGY
jgi:hypothetical protein